MLATLEDETAQEDLSQADASAENDAITGAPYIQLEGNVSIQHIANLFEQFKASLLANEEIEIDTSAVSSIDTATLQLLVSLKLTANKQQKQVVFSQPSAKFIESVKLLGLSETLAVD